jgi:hypothetical protein
MRPNASMCPARLDALMAADRFAHVFSELCRGDGSGVARPESPVSAAGSPSGIHVCTAISRRCGQNAIG